MLLFNYFWVVFIIVTTINAFAIKRKADDCITTQPELEIGYRKVFKAVLIYGNIPWVIMGIGVVSGLTKDISEFFHPSGLNPMVLLLHAYIFGLYLLAIRWVYFKDGADFLLQHHGIVRWRGLYSSGDLSVKAVKGFVALAILGGIVGMLNMWFGPMSHMH